MQNTSYNCINNLNVSVDLSTVFKKKTSTNTAPQTYILDVSGNDLNTWFEPSSSMGTSSSDQISYDTKYNISYNGASVDLRYIFMNISNSSIFTATGTYTTINVGNFYAVQFTGTSGSINFNVNGITINYLVIGGGGSGAGKSTITSSNKKLAGKGGSLTTGNIASVQNSIYTISVGTGGVGGKNEGGDSGTSSSITNTNENINITANGGQGGSDQVNNINDYSINFNSISLTYSSGYSGFNGSNPSNGDSVSGKGGGINAGNGNGYDGGNGGLLQTFSNNGTMSFGNGGGGGGFTGGFVAKNGNGGSGSQGVVVLWFKYP